MNPTIDHYIAKLSQWAAEIQELREILLECGLSEEIKWGKPCYMYDNKNLIILYGLKESFAIGFMKGVLLQDTEKLLLLPGENSTEGKWMKFTDIKQIKERKAIIKAYVYEAIEIEKAGIKIIKNNELILIDEIQEILNADAKLKTAFDTLTPGRKRAYNLIIGGAKQSATRISRMESYIDRIMSGKGPGDCICGLSKRMPGCDGSHKYLKE